MAAGDKQREDINRDLGLGSRVAQISQQRFLNRDGSFNVSRRGLPLLRSLNFYHALLTMSWPGLFGLTVAFYGLINVLFAAGYLLCGDGALIGSTPGISVGVRFADAFFFSVQTLSTIGYGTMAPHGLAANILVSFEAFVGLVVFAMTAGLLFARFSRPSARIIYSRQAVIGPYRTMSGFMFRIANARSSELIELNATVTLSRMEEGPEGPVRKFYPLALERTGVVFFPLQWVIVHPIDELSPLHGVTRESLIASRAEFLILLTGVDETFFEIVHSRSSYRYDEVEWNARFADMFIPTEDGRVGIDLRKIHDVHRA